jgi:Tfp pilus assembly protein PilF
MKRQWILECCLLACISMFVLVIAGCSSLPAGTQGSSPAASSGNTAPSALPNSLPGAPLFERPSAGAAALREGVAAFNLGEYGRAEKKLVQSFAQGLTNTPDLLQGHKTQAFVYCVTARTALCEKSFTAALSVDKKFKLSANEQLQPVWGPVFSKVQRRVTSVG